MYSRSSHFSEHPYSCYEVRFGLIYNIVYVYGTTQAKISNKWSHIPEWDPFEHHLCKTRNKINKQRDPIQYYSIEVEWRDEQN